ncbi:hypothetical protein DAPPUDRAFT_117349 [Daphnia pulex]|uniref:Uncharacterized protein n=1 Tax=Daphnia pulex TaxID=6669 RepID=E9HSD4_DAPPU|nr:hypothetical protein DAPPUDRAFT_117349 [Daphnia pulex]|eukprot:EFX65350.1 hypothetical protein DAPPUDRAFT_117349 [Daphnia pulex]
MGDVWYVVQPGVLYDCVDLAGYISVEHRAVRGCLTVIVLECSSSNTLLTLYVTWWRCRPHRRTVSSGFQTARKTWGRLKTHVERKRREPFFRKKRGRLVCKRTCTVSSGKCQSFRTRARSGVAENARSELCMEYGDEDSGRRRKAVGPVEGELDQPLWSGRSTRELAMARGSKRDRWKERRRETNGERAIDRDLQEREAGRPAEGREPDSKATTSDDEESDERRERRVTMRECDERRERRATEERVMARESDERQRRE